MQLLDGALAIGCMHFWAFPQFPHSLCLLYFLLQFFVGSLATLLNFLQFLHDLLKIGFFFLLAGALSAIQVELDVIVLGCF